MSGRDTYTEDGPSPAELERANDEQLNNEHAQRIVFDIETAPLPDAAAYVEDVSAPANYKDPEKIAAYIAEKRAEQMERCGLDVDLCRVVAIGFQVEGREPVALTTERASEADILNTFWSHVGLRHLVGFNCLAFDLPVLFRRCQYLGLPYPGIAIDRFRHPQVTDLQMVLSFNGALKLRGLSFYCKRFGILDVADTLTGADIGRAVAEGRWADVAGHVRADIEKTGRLAERLHLFRARVEEMAV